MTIRKLFLLFILCQHAVWAQSGFQFETHKDKVVIPFQLINNLIFIPIQVNGIELNFLLDSLIYLVVFNLRNVINLI